LRIAPKAVAAILGAVALASLMAAPAQAQCDGMELMPDGNWEFNPKLCSQPPSAPAVPDKWTAIAVSDSTLSWGSSWEADSQSEAEQKALAACAKNAPDCKVEMWGLNMCLALATSQGDLSWGVDSDRNGEKAKAKALAQCRSGNGEHCVIVTWPCSHD
jgi:hypothetical protein